MYACEKMTCLEKKSLAARMVHIVDNIVGQRV